MMKALKWIIGILAVLALILLSLGIFKSEVAYDCDILVDSSLAESWAVTQDPDKMSEWLPGFKRFEHVSGTHGTVGAVSNVYFDQGGEEMMITETITAIVPNESIFMIYTSDFMDMDYAMKMTEVGDQTKISSSTTTKGNSMFSRSLMALSGGMIKAQEDGNLANLKKAIESNTVDYFPEPPAVDVEME